MARCETSTTAKDEGKMNDPGQILKIVEFEVASVQIDRGLAEIGKLAAR